MTSLDVLLVIERRDPEGGKREPTRADYLAFQRWAEETYGEDAWRAYQRGGWYDNQHMI